MLSVPSRDIHVFRFILSGDGQGLMWMDYSNGY